MDTSMHQSGWPLKPHPPFVPSFTNLITLPTIRHDTIGFGVDVPAIDAGASHPTNTAEAIAPGIVIPSEGLLLVPPLTIVVRDEPTEIGVVDLTALKRPDEAL